VPLAVPGWWARRRGGEGEGRRRGRPPACALCSPTKPSARMPLKSAHFKGPLSNIKRTLGVGGTQGFKSPNKSQISTEKRERGREERGREGRERAREGRERERGEYKKKYRGTKLTP